MGGVATTSGQADGFGGQGTEILFGKGKNPHRVHIPHHHYRSIVRGIPLAIPVPQVGDQHPLQVAGPANDGVAIGGGLIGDGIELLKGQSFRIILGAQPAFLLDYLQFLGKFCRGQGEGAHPLRLQFEGNGETIRGQGLEIGRVVPASEGIFVTAVGGNDAGKFARGQFFRTLEHHVFEQMGDAGQAAGLKTGTDLVPNL